MMILRNSNIADYRNEIKAWEAKTGISGYDILRMPNCPYKLPTGAKSMTTAAIDYYHLMPTLIDWYEKQSK